MHILFLTDNFPPEVNAPASRTYEHAREWVKQGAQVTIITCAPNFPQGKVFDGYKNRLRSVEDMDGIRVIRVWTYITANEGFYKRTLDYVSFMLSSFIASFGVRKVDVIIGTSPQFFTAISAFLVSLAKRRPWIFELRDLWPATIKTVGAIKNGRVLSLLEALEMFLYRRATRIVAVTHSFKEELAARGINADKIDVVTNGANLAHFKPSPKPLDLARTLGLEGRFVAGYVGTHGLTHGLETVLDAAEILQSVPGADHVRIVLLGDGARKADLKANAARRSLTNVVFLDSVPKAQVPDYWALLNVSIIHLRRDPLFRTVIPSKLFECMAMGIPVLHAVEGESAEIVRRKGVGLTVTPEDAGELAARIAELAAAPERLEAFREKCLVSAERYDRANLARRMYAILSQTANTRASRP
ncbi:glycosyltransferase family 4 protein [Glycocaulis abyssi]|uniref:Glycosyltransferase family 4 protein n=1 Tax=Glycocaulis abyssi TaxID=1433403 RepID=A0ABV9NF05_9PROT